MSLNNRLYFPIQQVGFAKDDGNLTFVAAHGVQSVGVTTSFTLDNVFEMGQLAIYDSHEQIPDVQMTAEKVLDGYPLLYHLATNGATVGTLAGRSNVRSVVGLALFADTLQSSSGTPQAEIHMSGMVPSSISYTFSNDGASRESITMVGNNKDWVDSSTGGTPVFAGAFTDNLDLPSGGFVAYRENIVFAPLSGSPTGVDPLTGAVDAYQTVLPTDIYGVTSSGTNPLTNGVYDVSVNSISVSADLGRDAITQLGRKTPYFRYVNFPVEVRTDIEVIARGSDNVRGTEAGVYAGGKNLKYQTIRVQSEEGTRVDTGNRNKLTSHTTQGGDAAQGGGNVTYRYSYLTYNTLKVYHPSDPSAISWANS